MTKRVYKFTSSRYGISNLENRRLKVSTIEDLNDPFDLCPIDTTNPVIAELVNAVTPGLWNTTGILCFSRNWDNILLWSHYGDSHKGVCLGFDIPDGDIGSNYNTDVHYQPNVLQIRDLDDLNLRLTDRLIRTKHESWSYEQEVRCFVELSDPPGVDGFSWIEFGPRLVLKEIIIGAQCDPTVSKQVEEAVKPFGNAVRCSWAGMRTDAFLLLKQDHPPYWHATVTDAPASR